MEEDNAWVFDSLVTFLNGPIWNAPLQSFIEEKSLIFEPNTEDNEEHLNIFEEFKNLVDFMLGSFMEDIGINSEQFENACKESKKYQVAFDPASFEQVWAANDYEMFKKMMIERNVELQLQALELIERKYGKTPQSFVPKDKQEHVREIPVTIEQPSSSSSEQNIMKEASKKFSTETDEAPSSPIKVEKILEEKEMLTKKLKETKEKSITPSVSFEKNQVKTEIIEDQIDEKKVEDVPRKEIDAIELKKRQDYLRAQRDKLVALKKEARRKQLDSSSSTSKTTTRPKSAKAAEAVLSGGIPNIEAHQLPVRKTLAERLRSEVVAYKK